MKNKFFAVLFLYLILNVNVYAQDFPMPSSGVDIEKLTPEEIKFLENLESQNEGEIMLPDGVNEMLPEGSADKNLKLERPLTPEEVQFLDGLKDSKMKPEEVVLPNGENMVDFLCKKDKAFMEENYATFKIKCKN